MAMGRLPSVWLVRAVTLGIAANEKRRGGLDVRKQKRLLAAGADLIVTSFSHHEALVRLLLAGELHHLF
jgi:hypothetical protein